MVRAARPGLETQIRERQFLPEFLSRIAGESIADFAEILEVCADLKKYAAWCRRGLHR